MDFEAREEFRVGAWLVRPRLNRVEGEDGRVTQVQPKIMDVLVLLASRAGEVVTKEVLLKTVWAGTHVTEHVLSRAVSELRKLFDDSAQEPRYVETIPKVGYRLIAPVTTAAAAAPPAEENPEIETPAPARAQAVRAWAGSAALGSLALLALVLAYLLLNTRHVGPWHFGH